MTLAVGSVAVLGLAANWLAAGLLAFTIFFYVAIYTMWLKRSTPQNIVIGGAAGAFPPVIGWAATTGGIGVEALIMFLIIFFWTPPHFWALYAVARGRLCPRRHPDAAGGRRAARDPAADSDLFARACPRSARCRGSRVLPDRSMARSRSSRAPAWSRSASA